MLKNSGIWGEGTTEDTSEIPAATSGTSQGRARGEGEGQDNKSDGKVDGAAKEVTEQDGITDVSGSGTTCTFNCRGRGERGG